MKIWSLSLTLVLLVGCASTGPQKPAETKAAPAAEPAAPAPSAAPPEGTAPNCAKIDATTEPAGLKAEGQWLHDHYPGWKKLEQSVSPPGEKIFDYLVIQTPSGEKHNVCFDITSFFGKF